jgi:flagellar motor switch protein FliM
MAVKDLLSQEEINALLNNSSDDLVSGDGDSLSDPLSEKEQENSERNYLSNRSDREISVKFPMLESVNERFSGLFQLALSKLLGCKTEITLYGTRSLKFSDYTHSLFIPTSLNIALIKPFEQIGLFVFDPKLVFMLVDKYFGGEGRPFNINEGREFAPTELRVIEMILEKLFVTFKDAWSPITSLEPEFVSSEVNPQLTNVLAPNDNVIVIIFHVSMNSAEGDLHVAMPCSMLESLQKQSENNE